jgi:osmotically-inducible protein OsmY
MRRLAGGSVVFVFLLLVYAGMARTAEEMSVVGASVADQNGSGVIGFAVDPAADPQAIADQVRKQLELTGGAKMGPIAVFNGMAQVEFTGATKGETITARLPAQSLVAEGEGPAVAASKAPAEEVIAEAPTPEATAPQRAEQEQAAGEVASAEAEATPEMQESPAEVAQAETPSIEAPTPEPTAEGPAAEAQPSAGAPEEASGAAAGEPTEAPEAAPEMAQGEGGTAAAATEASASAEGADSVIGEATLSDDGNGNVCIVSEPPRSPEEISEMLSKNLALSGGAKVESIDVQNNVAEVQISGPSNERVVAKLPAALAKQNEVKDCCAVAAARGEGVDGVIGRTTLRDDGTGAVCVASDPRLTAEEISEVLSQNLELSGGAKVESIQVENAVAEVQVSGPANERITATLPSEVAQKNDMRDCKRVMACGAVPAGGGGPVVGWSTGTKIGIGAVAITAGTLGGLAAAGEFSEDDRIPNAGEPQPPPGPTPQPPPPAPGGGGGGGPHSPMR